MTYWNKKLKARRNMPSEAKEQETQYRRAKKQPHNKPKQKQNPNGGSRTIHEGAALKRQGVKAGVSDLFFAYPAAPYHGLWIELKRIGGILSPMQKDWLRLMNLVGYKAIVAYGWESARDEILTYLSQWEIQ